MFDRNRRAPAGPGRGVDQGYARAHRVFFPAGTAQFNVFKVDVPPGSRTLWIERNPWTAGQCFVMPGRPDANLMNGVAPDVTRLMNAIDVASFQLLTLDEGVDELYLISTAVVPTGGFAFSLVRGELEPAGASSVTIAGQAVGATPLLVNALPRRTIGFTTAGWQNGPFAVAAGAVVLVASNADVQGFYVTVFTAAGQVWIRSNNVAAPAGMVVRQTDAPLFVPGNGSFYAYNPGGAAVDVAVAELSGAGGANL